MSYAPEAILEVRRYLKPITGLSDIELGIVGDDDHDGGYHFGIDGYDSDGTDYSWDESPRDWGHKSNAARALDIGMFAQLRELSIWLVHECEIGAPGTEDIREIIYSPDGQVVKRWDRLGIRTGGDPSHLKHTHVSWFADAEFKSKVGPFKRFFEGGNMDGYGDLGPPTNLAPYNYNFPDTMLADMFAALVIGDTGWGKADGHGADNWALYQRLAEIKMAIGAITFTLTDAQLDVLATKIAAKMATPAQIADAVVDEEHQRLAT